MLFNLGRLGCGLEEGDLQVRCVLQLAPLLAFGGSDVRQEPLPQPGAERAAKAIELWLQPVVLVVRPFEDRRQPIVVAMRDRIELVAVAACALEG